MEGAPAVQVHILQGVEAGPPRPGRRVQELVGGPLPPPGEREGMRPAFTFSPLS